MTYNVKRFRTRLNFNVAFAVVQHSCRSIFQYEAARRSIGIPERRQCGYTFTPPSNPPSCRRAHLGRGKIGAVCRAHLGVSAITSGPDPKAYPLRKKSPERLERSKAGTKQELIRRQIEQDTQASLQPMQATRVQFAICVSRGLGDKDDFCTLFEVGQWC